MWQRFNSFLCVFFWKLIILNCGLSIYVAANLCSRNIKICYKQNSTLFKRKKPRYFPQCCSDKGVNAHAHPTLKLHEPVQHVLYMHSVVLSSLYYPVCIDCRFDHARLMQQMLPAARQWTHIRCFLFLLASKYTISKVIGFRIQIIMYGGKVIF